MSNTLERQVGEVDRTVLGSAIETHTGRISRVNIHCVF
jgi:hypothetical protein